MTKITVNGRLFTGCRLPCSAAAIGLASIALAGVARVRGPQAPAPAPPTAADDVKDDEFKVEYQSVYGKKRFA